jgi:hypothetical protein
MSSKKSQRRFDGLPLDDPRVITWVIEDHENRLTDLENQEPEPTGQIQTPLGKMPWWLVAGGIGLLALFFPKEFSALLMRVGL